MIFIRPEHCICNQKIGNLRTSIIKNQSSPVWMHALSRIRMLIQTSSIKIRQSKIIFWKMCRHPVQNHTNSLFMKIVHKVHKIFTCSITAGRRIISGHLITPGTIKRMFHHRHQFHVSISHLFYILGNLRCKFTVSIKQPVLRFSPRT